MASLFSLSMQCSLSRLSLFFLLLHKLKSSTCTDLIVFLYSFMHYSVSGFAYVRALLRGSFGNVLQVTTATHLIAMLDKCHDNISATLVDIVEVS